MSSSDKIKGKVCLVTGANRGIGKSLVECFVQHGASKVYVAVRNVETANPLVQKFGDRVVPIYMDLSKPETIYEAAKAAQDVNIVVNNAGVLANDSDPLSTAAAKNLEYEFQVNVYGFLHVAQAFAPILQAQQGPAVLVQINSVASMRCAAPRVSTYSASKAAAYSLTQSIRMQLKETNIHVLSVHPGPIATDMIQNSPFANIAEPPNQVAEAVVSAIQKGPDVFHVYPDSKSRSLGKAYEPFAKAVVEPCNPYGETNK